MRFLSLLSGLWVLALLASCSPANTVTETNGIYTDNFTTDKDGLKHGEFRRFYGDTLAELSHYKHGTLSGERLIYHQNGWLEISEHYIRDTLHGQYQVFDSAGQVMIEGAYEHGVMRGQWKRFYRSGALLEEVTYEDNEENGPFTEYFENGNIKAKGQYKGGDFEHDSLYLYLEDGSLERKMFCRNGICNTVWKLEEESDDG